MHQLATTTERDRVPLNRQSASSIQSSPSRMIFEQKIKGKSACACGGGCPRCASALLPNIQTKLAISTPGDQYEQEADRVADHVMRMPSPTLQRACADCSTGGGSCPTCASEEDGLVQRKTGAPSEGSSSVSESFVSDLGPGQPLEPATRAYFEPRFNHDFIAVRVHSNAAAAQSAHSVNAQAYTVGRDIVFGAGRYMPGNSEGNRLIAHELAHVVQQGQGSQPLQVARLTEEEKEENLTSPKYSGDARLQKAFDNDPLLKKNESGDAVRLVQEGLVDDGFEMPLSTKPTGEMDGVFGDETLLTVRKFQLKHGLDADGIVGRDTLRRLDELAQAAPCVFPVGIFNGPDHEPFETDLHAGMTIDVTVMPSNGRRADLAGVIDSELISQSFDHTGSVADSPPLPTHTGDPQSADDDEITDDHVMQKALIIDRALNHGGNGSLAVHQLDVFTHPRCGITAPTVVPRSGHRIDMIITRGPGDEIELTVRKSAEACTVNGFTSSAGPSLTHSDTVLIQPGTAVTQCPPDPTAFEVTNEKLFANPKFDFEFSGGDRPSLSTRAPSAPFRWNATVKKRKPIQGCFDIGFLQTLSSAFQDAVYDSQTGGQGLTCLVLVPTPIRDSKSGAPEPWFTAPMRIGTNCFTDVFPPGLIGDLDEQTVLMDDNPFLQWCIFLEADANNPATDCGLANAAFRLNSVVESLSFDAWLVLRPRGSTDPSCFTFLRHANWVKSVEIIAATTGALGFLRRNLGVTLIESGDGIGATKPEFGSPTPNEEAERVCF